ncbi:MAG: DUF7594 domain-containing protein [Acidimicrobiia bacterium]
MNDARVASRRARVAVAVALAGAGLVPGGRFLPSAGAAPATVVLQAAADATVSASDPGDNDGAADTLFVDGDPVTEAYVRFGEPDLAGPLGRAVLRLYVTDRTYNAPEVYRATGGWTESGITWDNRPGRQGSMVDDHAGADEGAWIEYDVTAAVGGSGTTSLVLVADSGDGIDLASRQSAEHRPQLLLEAAGTAGTSSRVFTPIADTHVNEDEPNRNFGDSRTLVTQEDPDPRIESLLRFRVDGLDGPVTAARLRLLVTSSTGDGPQVRAVGGGWDEATVTWDDRPTTGASPVDDLGDVDRGWVELDVSAVVRGEGTWNLLLSGGEADAFRARSREGSSGDRPELVVETTGGAPTTSSTTTTTRPPSTTTTTTRPDSDCDDDWGGPDRVGELPSGRGEMSGMVASTFHRGWGWGVRDSGNPAALYSMRLDGDGDVTTDEFAVPGAANSDWEDTAYVPAPAGPGTVWVLENIGNFYGGTRRFYAVAEPDPDHLGPTVLVGRYDWAYPDTQYNTEAVFFFDGDLVVVAKTSPSRVYRFEAPLLAGVVNEPRYVGTLAEGSNLSVASLSPDQRLLAVASHNSLHVYENRGDSDELSDLIAGEPVFSDRLPDDNRESGGFFPAGSSDIVLVAESKNDWRLDQ